MLTVQTWSGPVAEMTAAEANADDENSRLAPSEQVAETVVDSNVDGNVQVTDVPPESKVSEPIASPVPLNDVGVDVAVVSGVVSVAVGTVAGVDSAGGGTAPGRLGSAGSVGTVASVGTVGAPGTVDSPGAGACGVSVPLEITVSG